MRTLAITDFKAHALQILGQVAKNKEHIIITKRGKPLAEVVPFTSSKPKSGKLNGVLLFEKDIVAPLDGQMWSANK